MCNKTDVIGIIIILLNTFNILCKDACHIACVSLKQNNNNATAGSLMPIEQSNVLTCKHFLKVVLLFHSMNHFAYMICIVI
jgi:hypothetical protein